MTRSQKRLIASLLLVALLGGTYALLRTHPAEEEEVETSSLTAIDSEDVTKIAVSLRGGDTFTVNTASDDSGTAYTMKGDKSGSYDENALSSLLSAACAVSGTLVDPVCTELDRYGLDEESQQDTVTITQSDGTETTLRFGLTSDTLGGTYCLLSDSTDVYFVSSDTTDTLLQKQNAYLSLSVLGSYYTLSTSLTSMTIRPQDGTTVAFQQRDTSDMDSDVTSAYSTFLLTKPERWDADDDKLTDSILSNLQTGLTAQSIAKRHGKDANLSKYGLDTPRFRIDLSFSNESFTVLVGDTDEDIVYVMREGSDTVYACPADSFTFLNDLDWTQYRSPYLLAFAQRELKSAKLTYQGSTYRAALTDTAADENETDSEDTLTGTLNGETMDSSAVNQLTVALTTLKSVSVLDQSASGSEVLSLTLRLTDGTRHTLSLIKGGSREYIADVDGSGYRFTVSQTDVSSLLDSFGAK